METNTKNYTIDASGKRLGKVATEAAALLLGKNNPSYARHIMEDVTVEITNASKLDISEKRSKEEYQSFSGHPGGRRVETLDHLGKRLGYGEALKRTIGGMLPTNKHKKPLLQKLVITE